VPLTCLMTTSKFGAIAIRYIYWVNMTFLFYNWLCWRMWVTLHFVFTRLIDNYVSLLLALKRAWFILCCIIFIICHLYSCFNLSFLCNVAYMFVSHAGSYYLNPLFSCSCSSHMRWRTSNSFQPWSAKMIQDEEQFRY